MGPFPKNYENVEKTLRELRRTKYGKSPTTAEEIKSAFNRQVVMDGLWTSLYIDKGALYNGIQIHENYCNCIFSSPSSISLIQVYIYW